MANRCLVAATRLDHAALKSLAGCSECLSPTYVLFQPQATSEVAVRLGPGSTNMIRVGHGQQGHQTSPGTTLRIFDSIFVRMNDVITVQLERGSVKMPEQENHTVSVALSSTRTFDYRPEPSMSMVVITQCCNTQLARPELARPGVTRSKSATLCLSRMLL